MKRFFALLAALLLILTAAGCAALPAGIGKTPAPEGQEASAPAEGGTETLPAPASSEEEGKGSAQAQSIQSSSLDSATSPLTEDEVIAAYERADEAYGWFKLNTLPCSSSAVTVDGTLYQRVDYSGINTLEDLKTYLRDLFSEEIVQELLPSDAKTPQYRDIDGVLYEMPGSRGTDIYKGESTVAVSQTGDDSYAVNVTVELLDQDLTTVTGMECFSFPYEKQNGRWVFTDFDLVY
jgi:hypothetical protein